MRFILLALMTLPGSAFATCGEDLYGPAFTERVRQVQKVLRAFAKVDNLETIDTGHRYLELAQQARDEARRRLPELPQVERDTIERRFAKIDLTGAYEMDTQEMIDLSQAVSMTHARLRYYGKTSLGATPALLVALAAMTRRIPKAYFSVRQIDPNDMPNGRFVIEPMDEMACDLVVDTTIATRDVTAKLRTAFAPRYLSNAEVARQVATRLGAMVRRLPKGRVQTLVTRLTNETAFGEIRDTLEEIHLYFETAVYMNRASGVPDFIE